MKKKTPRASGSSSRKKWQKFIDEWISSNLPGTDYCEQKKLSYSSFRRWKKHAISINPLYFAQAQKYTSDQWREIIADWKQSGISANAYCIRKKLCQTTFYGWRKKLERSLASQESTDPPKESSSEFKNLLQDFFVPVGETASLPLPSIAANQKLEVVFAQGERLYLHGPFDWEKLDSWLTPLLTAPQQATTERMECYGNKNELL